MFGSEGGGEAMVQKVEAGAEGMGSTRKQKWGNHKEKMQCGWDGRAQPKTWRGSNRSTLWRKEISRGRKQIRIE